MEFCATNLTGRCMTDDATTLIAADVDTVTNASQDDPKALHGTMTMTVPFEMSHVPA